MLCQTSPHLEGDKKKKKGCHRGRSQHLAVGVWPLMCSSIAEVCALCDITNERYFSTYCERWSHWRKKRVDFSLYLWKIIHAYLLLQLLTMMMMMMIYFSAHFNTFPQFFQTLCGIVSQERTCFLFSAVQRCFDS